MTPVRLNTRRAFLRSSVAGGLVCLTALPQIARAAAGAELARFTPARARLLLAVARTLFPHAFLGDAHYFESVRRLDAMAAERPEVATRLDEALSTLPADFATRPADERERALAPLAASPAFALMRSATANALYRSAEVWPHFDYPGPSVGFGGYVGRSLVDLPWLEAAVS